MNTSEKKTWLPWQHLKLPWLVAYKTPWVQCYLDKCSYQIFRWGLVFLSSPENKSHLASGGKQTTPWHKSNIRPEWWWSDTTEQTNGTRKQHADSNGTPDMFKNRVEALTCCVEKTWTLKLVKSWFLEIRTLELKMSKQHLACSVNIKEPLVFQNFSSVIIPMFYVNPSMMFWFPRIWWSFSEEPQWGRPIFVKGATRSKRCSAPTTAWEHQKISLWTTLAKTQRQMVVELYVNAFNLCAFGPNNFLLQLPVVPGHWYY